MIFNEHVAMLAHRAVLGLGYLRELRIHVCSHSHANYVCF